MEPEFDPKLESLLSDELKSLPPVKAPASLLPNVMAVLAARARMPWWQHAWWDWPLTAKVAFVLLAVSIAGLLGGGGSILGDSAAGYSTEVLERFNGMEGTFDLFAPLVDAAALVWARTAQPFLLYGVFIVGALYLMCVGMGTACVRYALKRA